MHADLHLDPRTLSFLEFLVTLSAALIIPAGRRRHSQPGKTLWWAGGFAFLSLATIPAWASLREAAIFTPLLRAAGFGCMWMGMAYRQKGFRPAVPLMAASVSAIATALLLTHQTISPRSFNLVLSGMQAATCLAVAVPLLPSWKKFAVSFTTAVFIIYATTFILPLHAIIETGAWAGRTRLFPGMASIACPVLALFGMLLMISEQLQNRIRRGIREMRMALEQTEKALASEREAVADNIRFITTITEECRPPLADIVGLLRDLEQEPDSGPRIKKMLGAAARMEEIMDTALDKDRLVDADIVPKKERMDLGATVRELVGEIRAGHHMDCTISPVTGHQGEILINGDQALLRTLLLNLVDNAAKYSPRGSMVNVEVRSEDGRAVIRVEDNGPGIPPEDRSQVFNKYYRGRNGVREAGAGVGLHLVKLIARQHGGGICIEDGRTKGTAVAVHIPLERNHA